jgi:hypothetical protein
MGANNAELDAGRSVTAYHVSAKANRASIERNGLIPGEPWNGKKNRIGVFGSLRPKTVEHYASYADNRSLQDDEGNWKPNTEPHEGGDIWEFTVPAGNVVNDTWTMPRGSAVRHPEPVPASAVRRVGHITGTNEAHWHPEENCGR